MTRAATDQQTEAHRPAREVDVLHVITSTQRRGAETFAVDLDAALNALGMTSEVVALTSGGRSGDGATLDVPVLGLSTLAPATLRALRQRAAGAAVVVAHGSRTLPASVLALTGSAVPIVYRSIGDPTAWATGPRRRTTTRLLLRRTRAVAALWPAAADALRAMHGLPADKLHVVPNAVPRARCPVPDKAAGAAARAQLGVPSGVPVVACIGSLAPEKQVGVAVEAVARLDGVHLLVVGDGPEANTVRDQVRQTAPDRIHVVGPMPGPTEALAAADVLLLTSRTEGMPGVLIEAGLSGRAAVATDVGGVSEIVRDGETGVLVPLDDVGTPAALAARVANGLRRALLTHAELGAAARERCLGQFEIEPVAARWQTLLVSVSGR